jgi:hypothetical protein
VDSSQVGSNPISGFKTSKARALLVYLAEQARRTAGRRWRGLFWRLPGSSAAPACGTPWRTCANCSDSGRRSPIPVDRGETLSSNPDAEVRVDVGNFDRRSGNSDQATVILNQQSAI